MTLYIDHEPLNEIIVPKKCRIIDEKQNKELFELKVDWEDDELECFKQLITKLKQYLLNAKEEISTELESRFGK